jgi:glycosyltransferase involved in cell wall biosynthesis
MVESITRLVHRLGIDILHPHEVVSNMLTYAASFRRRVPIVTTKHGWITNSVKQRFFKTVDKVIAKRYDCVIAVSRKIQDELLAAGVSSRKVRLVHNAIVWDRYKKTGRNGFLQQTIARKLETPVLVSIGRMSPEKGHADLIEAVRLLAADGRRFSVVLVGDGPQRRSLETRVREMGLADRVHFPGYLSDTARVLEHADLTVLPSHTEGLPNAALEALAMEVPVLATRVGGTPEVITDGETGRLVPPNAPAALAAGIAEFLDNRERWRQMAVCGRAMVERQFDFGARTRHVEAIYTELIQEMATHDPTR